MGKRLLVTILVLVVAVASGVFLAGIQQEDTPAVLPQPGVELSASPSSPASSPPRSYEAESSPAPSSSGYLLLDYQGRVAVMASDGQTPEMIFDIFTKTLPEEDRRLLRQGIYVETYEALARLIEDYIS